MQLIWRPLRQGEVDHELIWFSVSVTGLLLGAIWLAAGLPWPFCWFHQLTGHPCATCGATRAAVAFFHADLFTAWKWNPLAFVSYVGIALFDIYALTALTIGRNRLRAALNPTEKNMLRGFAVVALLANWTYLLAHSGMFNG